MGVKNKELANQRRRQRRAEKSKARIAQKTVRHVPGSPAASLAAMTIGTDLFSDHDMVFWICHGINCILSDYGSGTWTPMFEEIYSATPVLPTPDGIIQTVMDRYNTDANKWPHEAKAALAWAVQDRNIIFTYHREAIRRLTAAYGGDADIATMAISPHQTLVWALFDYMRSKVLNRRVEYNK